MSFQGKVKSHKQENAEKGMAIRTRQLAMDAYRDKCVAFVEYMAKTDVDEVVDVQDWIEQAVEVVRNKP